MSNEGGKKNINLKPPPPSPSTVKELKINKIKAHPFPLNNEYN
jgi:hypothetical protein